MATKPPTSYPWLTYHVAAQKIPKKTAVAPQSWSWHLSRTRSSRVSSGRSSVHSEELRRTPFATRGCNGSREASVTYGDINIQQWCQLWQLGQLWFGPVGWMICPWKIVTFDNCDSDCDITKYMYIYIFIYIYVYIYIHIHIHPPKIMLFPKRWDYSQRCWFCCSLDGGEKCCANLVRMHVWAFSYSQIRNKSLGISN